MEAEVIVYINELKKGSKSLGLKIEEYLRVKHNTSVLFAEINTKSETLIGRNLFLTITIGGDGTVLSAAKLLLENNINIPIISINMGKLGFLADIRPEDFEEVLDKFFDNSLNIQKRFLLSVKAYKNKKLIISKYSLNDVVVRSKTLNKIIYLDLKVNSEDFLSYYSDGIILSTPTGSTGYSFSAGGPVLEADLEGFLLTPISPHSVYNRSFVFSRGSKVSLSLPKIHNTADAIIFIDGSSVLELEIGSMLEFEISDKNLNFASFCTDTFVKRLKNKLL